MHDTSNYPLTSAVQALHSLHDPPFMEEEQQTGSISWNGHECFQWPLGIEEVQAIETLRQESTAHPGLHIIVKN